MKNELRADLIESIKKRTSYKSLVELVLTESGKVRQEEKEDLLERAKYLYQTLNNPNKTFKLLAKVLKLDSNCPFSHHYLGSLLEERGKNTLFYQAQLLFDQGLRIGTNDIHRDFHYDLAGMGFVMHERGQTLKQAGYPMKRLNFHFSPEKGFYLPDFDYNSFNADYTDLVKGLGKRKGMIFGKERTLLHIHSDLGSIEKIQGKEHTNSNCPYLNYLTRA